MMGKCFVVQFKTSLPFGNIISVLLNHIWHVYIHITSYAKAVLSHAHSLLLLKRMRVADLIGQRLLLLKCSSFKH